MVQDHRAQGLLMFNGDYYLGLGGGFGPSGFFFFLFPLEFRTKWIVNWKLGCIRRYRFPFFFFIRFQGLRSSAFRVRDWKV